MFGITHRLLAAAAVSAAKSQTNLIANVRRPFSKRKKPFQGEVRIGNQTGLRKLMRAARRGKLPDDRVTLIEFAKKGAARPHRQLAHMSAGQRSWIGAGEAVA